MKINIYDLEEDIFNKKCIPFEIQNKDTYLELRQTEIFKNETLYESLLIFTFLLIIFHPCILNVLSFWFA